jgi:protein KTI12
MPLIIITGRPCTGKTMVAQKLKEYFVQENIFEDVVVVNEEALKLSKLHGYASSNHEKQLRGSLKSAMEHAMIRSGRLVIIDSLNYIKGYRYEMYCTAKTARTPHCVVWVAANDEDAKLWNIERKNHGEDGYDEKL